MEFIMNLIGDQHWVVIALLVFTCASHILNGVIAILDGIELLLKGLGKPYAWVDKVTNALATVVSWIGKILTFANAKKVKKGKK